MKSLLIFITLIALYPALLLANSRDMPHKVQIEIVADDGRVFPFHNFHQAEKGNMHRAYLEAVYGEIYHGAGKGRTRRRAGGIAVERPQHPERPTGLRTRLEEHYESDCTHKIRITGCSST